MQNHISSYASYSAERVDTVLRGPPNDPDSRRGLTPLRLGEDFAFSWAVKLPVPTREFPRGNGEEWENLGNNGLCFMVFSVVFAEFHLGFFGVVGGLAVSSEKNGVVHKCLPSNLHEEISKKVVCTVPSKNGAAGAPIRYLTMCIYGYVHCTYVHIYIYVLILILILFLILILILIHIHIHTHMHIHIYI